MFQFIHQLTTGPEDILTVTKDVVKKLIDDGVKSLELDKEAPEQAAHPAGNMLQE